MLKHCFTVILALFLVVFVYVGAGADNAGIGHSDYQGSSTSLRTVEERQAVLRQQLFEFKISSAWENKNLQLLDSLLHQYMKVFGKGTVSAFAEVSILSVPSPVYLGVSTIGQEHECWCGPASAVQLINYLGITQNPVDYRTTNQSNLADDLWTNCEHGTYWVGNWQPTLRSWTQEPYIAVDSNLTESLVWNATVTNVLLGLPLIYDAVMSPTNGYLVGYSGETETIYHYVTGDGFCDEYEANGELYPKTIRYVDPNRFRTAAYGPHWISLSQLYNCVRHRGIAY